MAAREDNRNQSRRKTIWEGITVLTETQAFIKGKVAGLYKQRHPDIRESNEADMINSYPPTVCPYCKSARVKKFGLTRNGVQRYRCMDCGKTFLPTTGTIFDEHRIAIGEWVEYCMNLFRHVSITADSWNNRNAFTTSRYWLQKVFLTLENSQNDIMLTGSVWLDETFYSVMRSDLAHDEFGERLRGLSRNQLCIGVATDKTHSLFLLEGAGKPSQKKTYETFCNHIRPGSVLIHDGEKSHNKLIEYLNLESEVFDSHFTRGMSDVTNPLAPVNRQHALLKHFLRSHSGFNRSDLQGYLDLFSFVTNPPDDHAEKIENLLKRVFQNPKLLRYRDCFAKKQDVFKHK